jgi:hypothetical protein
VADSLVLASAAMGQGGSGRGLVFHVVRARRVVSTYNDNKTMALGLELGEGTVFAEDGSEPRPDARDLAVMEGFRMYEDVINRQYPAMHEEYRCNDQWWKDADGGSIYYAGNEGAVLEQTYFCHVLIMWPKSTMTIAA